MTDAQALILALGGRWRGRYGMAPCPCHHDRHPSLAIRQGVQAPLLKCFAGCPQETIIDALRMRGLWAGNGEDGARKPRPIQRQTPKRRRPAPDTSEAARRLWEECRPAAGTLAETYLRARGITLPVPPSLRFHPALKHGPTGLRLPAMVAAVQAPDRRVVAVQRTFLRQDGGAKATVSAPRLSLGPMGAGAARLAKAGSVLGIAEGIEDALSAMQLTGTPCWAVLGAARLGRVALPSEVKEVHVFADADDAGQEAAERAVRRFRREGRAARLFTAATGNDLNDALRAGGRLCV